MRPTTRSPEGSRRARSATSRPGSRMSRGSRSATRVTTRQPARAESLPGYRPEADGLRRSLPVGPDDYPELRDALEKLKLNDASLAYEPESSEALGFGFRCGFLGLLHMEIVQERLEREFDLDLLATAPSVEYEVKTSGRRQLVVDNPAEMPREDPRDRRAVDEQSGIVPTGFIGAVMELVDDRRGEFEKWSTWTTEGVRSGLHVPLGEIVLDFYDQLKSRTRGYACSTTPGRVPRREAVRGHPRQRRQVDALSLIIHRDAYERGRMLVERPRRGIPRQMFDVAIQAAIGRMIAARRSARAQERHRQVLRRRHLAQAQAAGEAEGGQEADEDGGRVEVRRKPSSPSSTSTTPRRSSSPR